MEVDDDDEHNDKSRAALRRGGMNARQLARSTSVEERRVRAIMLDEWTPSRQDRDRIAEAFGLTRDRVVWGHKYAVQHLSGPT